MSALGKIVQNLWAREKTQTGAAVPPFVKLKKEKLSAGSLANYNNKRKHKVKNSAIRGNKSKAGLSLINLLFPREITPTKSTPSENNK